MVEKLVNEGLLLVLRENYEKSRWSYSRKDERKKAEQLFLSMSKKAILSCIDDIADENNFERITYHSDMVRIFQQRDYTYSDMFATNGSNALYICKVADPKKKVKLVENSVEKSNNWRSLAFLSALAAGYAGLLHPSVVSLYSLFGLIGYQTACVLLWCNRDSAKYNNLGLIKNVLEKNCVDFRCWEGRDAFSLLSPEHFLTDNLCKKLV